MDTNKRKVLEMLSEGKITPEEAEQLLDRLARGDRDPGESAPNEDQARGRRKGVGVSVNIGGMGDLLGNLGATIEKTSARVKEAAQATSKQGAGRSSTVEVSAGKGGTASAFSFTSGEPTKSSDVYVHSGSTRTELKQGIRKVDVNHVPDSALSVRTENGAVRVTRASGSRVSIQAVIRARSDERLKATTLSVARGDDGALHVEPCWPDDERDADEGCDFDIAVPDVQGVEIYSGNGSIDLRGLAGPAVLESANGSVTVHDQDGDVKVKTRNGTVTLEDIRGAAVAQTDNAAVEIHDVRGAVEIKGSNAAVEVDLTPDNEGPVHVTTSNARVNLSVGDAFKGSLTLVTSNGKVQYDEAAHVHVIKSEPQATQLQIGEDGRPSSVKTSNADIRVSF